MDANNGKVMQLSVLSMLIGVYMMNDVITEGEAARFNLVMKDAMTRLAKLGADAQRAPAPDLAVVVANGRGAL